MALRRAPIPALPGALWTLLDIRAGLRPSDDDVRNLAVWNALAALSATPSEKGPSDDIDHA